MSRDATWQAKRRRMEQFFNAATIRFRTAVAADQRDLADRASTDLLQVIDEMLVHIGLPVLTGSGQDCPDCGQFYPDAVDILTEGEGE